MHISIFLFLYPETTATTISTQNSKINKNNEHDKDNENNEILENLNENKKTSFNENNNGKNNKSSLDSSEVLEYNNYNNNNNHNKMRHDELFRLYLVVQEMRKSGVQADTAVYNTLINACAGVGDLEKALETVQAMQVGGCV